MELLRYLLLTSLYALAMWGIYAMTLRDQPAHRISRIYLLTAIALPGILPLLQLPATVVSLPAGSIVRLAEFRVDATPARAVHAANVLPLIYGLVCCTYAVFYACSYLRLRTRLSLGVAGRSSGYKLIYETGMGPGTLGRTIFIPGAAIEPAILRHEIGHIRSGHRFDLALVIASRVLFWISPAHRLLSRELRIVHEFEADRIAGAGSDSDAYVALLIAAQFGVYSPATLTQSFIHHPLKRRIMMLGKKASTNTKRLLAASVLLSAGFMGSALFAQTKAPGKPTQETAVASTKPLDAEVLERNYSGPRPGTMAAMSAGQMVFTKVDQMPKFGGGLMKWLMANVRAPERDIQGRCVVTFTIDQLGNVNAPLLKTSSGNPRLDAEAMRVVRSMPKWTPGIQAGSPVPVQYELPFNFGQIGDGC